MEKREIKTMLLNKKKELEQINKHQDVKEEWGEIPKVDNHPGDMGSETFFNTMDLSFQKKAQMEIERVEKALKKLEKGTFGFCESCNKKLSRERLKIFPDAEFCSECAEKREVQGYSDEIIPFKSKGGLDWHQVGEQESSETESDDWERRE